MKKSIISILAGIVLTSFALVDNLVAQTGNPDNIIIKKNGRIILAYRQFEDFLKTGVSWENYKKTVLDAYPEMMVAHNKAISWGTIDSTKFPDVVAGYKIENWEAYFNRYSKEKLNYMYDSLIARADKVLKPLNSNPVDLFLFLPYGGCYIIPGPNVSTIYISLLIDTADAPKIIIHEYSHNLHIQRRPSEPLTLKREVVSEGMAVYLTTLVLHDPGLTRSIPFMPATSVKWCFDNELKIKEAIKPELNDTTFNGLKKFIADGDIATPPKGFVEKTAYFTGYRIIEACIKKGIKLEDICSLSSESVIALSGYFN